MNDLLPLEMPLSRLEGADLIRRVKELEAAYQFKHNLIQESAYGSLLRNDRRTLHRACAEAIESGYPNELDENAALLAKHYAEAGEQAKTFAYALRAGDAAMRVHALMEALSQYETARGLTGQLPLATSEVVNVHQKYGRALEVMGRYPEAVTAYMELQALGKARGDAALEIGAMLPLATLYTFPNQAQNLEEAERVNAVVLALARETHDEQAEARVLWNMQTHAYFMGHPEHAVRYSQQALALADRLGMQELRAYILNDVSRALVTVESVPAALAALAEAREIWRKIRNLPMLVDNLSSTADAALWGGKMQMAEMYVYESQNLSRTIGNSWNLAYSQTTLIQICTGRGETQRVLELASDVQRLGEESGFTIAELVVKIQSATVYGELGDTAHALEILKALPTHGAFFFFEAWRSTVIALMELLDGNLPATHAALDHAVQYAQSSDLSSYGPIYVGLCQAGLALREQRYADAIGYVVPLGERMRSAEVHYFLPDLLLLQAQAHLHLNELDAAEKILLEAEQLARDMQVRARLWQILAARADLETLRGQAERAAALQQEARGVVDELAALAPQELRATFLAQPHVRAVMDA